MSCKFVVNSPLLNILAASAALSVNSHMQTWKLDISVELQLQTFVPCQRFSTISCHKISQLFILFSVMLWTTFWNICSCCDLGLKSDLQNKFNFWAEVFLEVCTWEPNQHICTAGSLTDVCMLSYKKCTETFWSLHFKASELPKLKRSKGSCDLC